MTAAFKSADFEKQRQGMVENQLKKRGIASQNVLDAMRTVPRERFVPDAYADAAYRDGPLPIGDGQTISQPYIVALMTQGLAVQRADRILEIGTGSGYQTAILQHLSDFVYSIERLVPVALQARRNLEPLGYRTDRMIIADGTAGWLKASPFDCIIVTSGSPRVPPPLKDQLAENGRMIIPVGSRHTQQLLTITRCGQAFRENELTACVFVPLIGEYGWHDN